MKIQLTRPALWLPLLLAMTTAQTDSRPLAKASGAVATISVTNQSTGTFSTQLSTNDVWSGMLAQAPGGPQRFAALGDNYVRLHVGDDGWPEAMPEVNYNQWDFSALDGLVNDVTVTHKQPLMNIKFAPDYQWTCYPNSAANGHHGTGTVADLTFQTFAQYMVRILDYYNLGHMTTETGQVINNPVGTANRITYWELWNEPDLNIETPCAPANGFGITSSQYVVMWNAVTSAMLAVDPSLKFIGPATAGGQFGGSTAAGNDYIDQLMAGGQVKPYAISFHGYGYWDNSVSDQTIFDGDATGAGGLPDIVNAVQLVRSTYPGIPLWLTEVNVNADWGDDPHQRPWTSFGAAWWGSLIQGLAPFGVQVINQFEDIGSAQFGLLDDTTGAPRLPYWEQKGFNAAFPAGANLLSSSSNTSRVLSLAVKRPDGKYSIMVVNRQQDSPSVTGGTGIAVAATVNLAGFNVQSVTLQQFDADTSATSGPSSVSLPASNSPVVQLPGYGFALLTVTTGPSATQSNYSSAPTPSEWPSAGAGATSATPASAGPSAAAAPFSAPSTPPDAQVTSLPTCPQTEGAPASGCVAKTVSLTSGANWGQFLMPALWLLGLVSFAAFCVKVWSAGLLTRGEDNCITTDESKPGRRSGQQASARSTSNGPEFTSVEDPLKSPPAS